MTDQAPPPETFRPLTIDLGPRAGAARTPDKIAIADGERTLTYAALVDRLDRVGNAALGGLGLQPGDRAALIAPNCLEYIEIVCGLAAAGVPVVTISPRLTPEEAAFICEDAGVRAVIVDPSWEAAAREARLAGDGPVVLIDDSYEDLLSSARSGRPDARPAEWDPFAIPYTSGTTGKPKGVVLSHRSRTLTCLAMAQEYGCYSPDDRQLAIAPLYHGAGFAFAMAAVYLGGMCEVLRTFEPEATLRALCEREITGTLMVPTHFNAIFALEPKIRERYRPTSLKALPSNAAALPQATKERIVDYFGEGLLHETYGSTEAGCVTNLRPADQLRKQSCVGLPYPCTRVQLIGEDGQEVAPGEVGELRSESPFLFNGYWRRPEETETALADGWCSVGDLARRDEEGYIYIVDRKNDMIVSGGINIYPREIEEVLHAHGAVHEAAVVAAPDEHWGEAVKAFVVLNPGAGVDGAALIAHCRARLAGYKIPKDVEFIDALPRNAAGKVLRRALRETAG
jgi:long-chain acyl-CoA synthetase